MSGQEPGLRERIASALTAWSCTAAGVPDTSKLMPKHREAVEQNSAARADAVLAEVQADLAAKDADVCMWKRVSDGCYNAVLIAQAERDRAERQSHRRWLAWQSCRARLRSSRRLNDELTRMLHRAQRENHLDARLQAEAERDRLRAELLTWLPRLGAHLDLGPEHDSMAMAMLGGTVKLAMKALYAALDQAPAESPFATGGLIVPTGPPRDPHATGLINDEEASGT